MKKKFFALLAISFVTSAFAQERYELGKPNNSDYRYLDNLHHLKEYIDYSKYPNFKLGVGTTVNDYLNNSLVRDLTNKNFSETVAGNAMKMSSCVDGNGNMNFETVKKYVQTATEAGLNVYGHTLAWHSQQPIGWLKQLLQGKKDPSAQEQNTVVYSKDFRKNQSVGWQSDNSTYGFKVSFDGTNGMKIHTTKTNPNFWDVQFQAATDIMLDTEKSYVMHITVKGSKAGTMHYKLGDFSTGTYDSFNFSTDWKEYTLDITPVLKSNFLLLQCGDFVGDVYVKELSFEGNAVALIPLTNQEKHDTLVYAMDKWIKGMMDACDGKVKAWDLVNEALAGAGDDGEGNYILQHDKNYNPNGTWDVGGEAFYWQDFMGDLEYVRQACRLARKYGPEDIVLFINDYNLESTWDDNKKLKSLINWIKKWEADGVTKIDGIGTQMHISYILDSAQQENQKKHITEMFKLMANSGKLVRVSELDMGICQKQFGNAMLTTNVTAAQEKKMAEYYEWIIKEYLRIIPPAQQWGICQWCPTDSPVNSDWRGGEPVGIWDLNYNRKHVYAGFVNGLGGILSDIEQIENASDNDVIYNIYGRKINAGDLNSQPSGLYIINGKKVMKK